MKMIEILLIVICFPLANGGGGGPPITPRPVSSTEAPCPECKYGECVQSVCECDTLYQGDSCDQMKPWFIGVICVVISLVLVGILTVVCCCCGSVFGVTCDRCKRKKKTQPTEENRLTSRP